MPVDANSAGRGSPALAEIVERHRFFQLWFNGEADEADFAGSLRHFDPEFRRVDPAGREHDRGALEAALSARRGSRRHDPIRIAVEKPRILWQARGAVLAAYVEAQGSAEGKVRERRLSTALLLVPEGDGPVVWRHVQETLVPTSTETGGSVFSAPTQGDGI